MDENEILLSCDRIDAELGRIRTLVGVPDESWAFPVGTSEAPPEKWYCAQYHTYAGSPSAGHTGIDLNLDRSPWGDVDRGFPVWAIAKGQVTSVNHSPGWVGVVVIRHEHQGRPLWVRYAHLAPDSIVSYGQEVAPGELVGVIGNYIAGRGGDHLHFDMCRDAFSWSWYRTSGYDWVDPVPILKAHLDPDRVDAMLRKGD